MNNIISEIRFAFQFWDLPQLLTVFGFNVYENSEQKYTFNEAVNLASKAIDKSNKIYLKLQSFELSDTFEGKQGWLFKFRSFNKNNKEDYLDFHVLVDKIDGVKFIMHGLEREQYFINFYSKNKTKLHVFYKKIYDFYIDFYPDPRQDVEFYTEFHSDYYDKSK